MKRKKFFKKKKGMGVQDLQQLFLVSWTFISEKTRADESCYICTFVPKDLLGV